MVKLSVLDLQLLHLGAKGNGNFDETDIAKSELNKMGVGRILDQLASLKERNLISMNKNKTFSITEEARKFLWDKNTSTELKILRILRIAPQTLDKISSFLLNHENQIQKKIEELQKNHLVLMSTVKNEVGIQKMYEILPEGLDYLDKADSGTIQNLNEIYPQLKNLDILQNTIQEIKRLDGISEEIKNKLISNLQNVKNNLES